MVKPLCRLARALGILLDVLEQWDNVAHRQLYKQEACFCGEACDMLSLNTESDECASPTLVGIPGCDQVDFVSTWIYCIHVHGLNALPAHSYGNEGVSSACRSGFMIA